MGRGQGAPYKTLISDWDIEHATPSWHKQPSVSAAERSVSGKAEGFPRKTWVGEQGDIGDFSLMTVAHEIIRIDFLQMCQG
jgi:hypothetical protein